MRNSRSNGRLHKPLETPAAHSDTINSMVVIRAGMVLSGGKDRRAVLTNSDNGEVYNMWQNRSEINKICYRNYVAKHSLIAAGRDGNLSYFMFQPEYSNEPIATFEGHKFGVTGVVNISEQQFMSGSRDCSVKLWDIETAKTVLTSTINRNLVTHLTYNYNTRLVAQTSEDKSVRLWDPRNMEIAVEFPRKRHIQMYCEFSGDDRLFSCSNGFNNDGCEITSYDLRNTRNVREIRGHEANVTSLAVVHLDLSRKLLASVSADRHIRLWRIEEDGESVLKPLWNEEVPLEADNLQVCTYADGHIIVSGGKGRLIHYQAKLAAQRVILDVQLIQKSQTIGQSSSSHVIRSSS
uniref:WD_REPEATS_REGION domain-containing protein n=1 Tax=Caenorhabditis japonica TaxID=281687 RepID=A0A8R1DZY0_CAEJA